MRLLTKAEKKEYEKYRLLWMVSHGFTLEDIVKQLQSHIKELDNNESIDLEQVFREWEFERGFNGEIWPCPQEWLDSDRDEPDGEIAVAIPQIGDLVVSNVHNEDFPGIAVDLKQPNGETVGLANIQRGDDGRLQAVLFTELGTDDYTHCVDYKKGGK